MLLFCFYLQPICCISAGKFWNLRLSQFTPVHPSKHPSSQNPFIWLHGSLSLQCPIHPVIHFNPKYPAGHSMQQMMKTNFNIYTKNVLCIYTHSTEALYFTFLTELSNPSRCTYVTGSVGNFTFWFRTVVCTGIVTVISINVKKDTSLAVNISFD